MNSQMPGGEGFIPFGEYKVWYRVVGGGEQPGKPPLLCLHGGPGVPHDYLEPLEALAATGRRVVFYDQLGVGNSDHPDDPALFTVDLYLEELSLVRRTLGLERVHLLGQSWGGMLALEYAVTRPEGLLSLTLADTPASMPQWSAEANRLRAALPPEARQTLAEHEAAGTTDDPAYQEAMMVFYRRHVCRLDPWPPCLERTFEKMMRAPLVYLTMVGPSEFHVTGTLKDWDITGRLGEIDTPTLVLAGRYDEATPEITTTLQRGIPGARRITFENSSHMPHLEEPELYLRVLSDFLDEAEARTGS